MTELACIRPEFSGESAARRSHFLDGAASKGCHHCSLRARGSGVQHRCTTGAAEVQQGQQ